MSDIRPVFIEPSAGTVQGPRVMTTSCLTESTTVVIGASGPRQLPGSGGATGWAPAEALRKTEPMMTRTATHRGESFRSGMITPKRDLFDGGWPHRCMEHATSIGTNEPRRT